MTVVQFAHVDYTRPAFHRWQWTFNKSAAGILVQFLGILITIALAQFWILLQSLWFAKDRVRNPTNAARTRQPRSLWEFIIDLLREAMHEISPPVQLAEAPPRARWRVVISRITLIATAFIIYVGILALGAVSNGLQGDSKVLTTSPDCGVYKQVVSGDYNSDVNYNTKAANDALQYARLCYGGRNLDYGCDQFPRKDIKYKTVNNDDCPWSGGMCHLGAHGAITFSTGPTPASALGINAKDSLQFDRTTTCAPVTMNSTFIKIQETSSKGCLVDSINYHYGWSNLIDNGNVSWHSYVFRNSMEKLPVYAVDATAQDFPSSEKRNSPLIAIPDMSPPNGSVLTMLYIQPGRIFYEARSDDPIFPATNRFTLGGFEFWEYNDVHARVLACVDRGRWRDLEDGEAWHEQNEIPSEPPKHVKGSKWLLWFALTRSNVYTITGKSESLNASSLLHTYSSAPVHPKQWEIEARQFFETTLARAQFEVKYLAEGVYASFLGWVRQSLDIITPAICRNQYISNNPDFANINGAIYLMTLIPCVLVIVLSCPWDDILLWQWLLGRERAGRWADAVVSVIELLVKATKYLAVLAWSIIKPMFLKTWALLKGGASHLGVFVWRLSLNFYRHLSTYIR